MLLQLGFELRRNYFEQIRIMRDERLVKIFYSEEEPIVSGAELYRTSEEILIRPFVCDGAT